MPASRISDLINSAHTIFLLTLDDLLLRKEWGQNAEISNKELNYEQDLEVIDLCHDLQLKATLFTPAIVASKFSKIMRSLSRINFEIAAHGYWHENLRILPYCKKRQLVDMTTESIRKVIGERVRGWRSPKLYIDAGFLRAIRQSEILWCSNMVLPSSLKHFPFINIGSGKVEIPIISSIDYNMYQQGFTSQKVIKKWLHDLEIVHNRRAREIFTLLIHPWIHVSCRERIEVLKTFLEKVGSMEGVCCMKCSDVAALLNPMQGSLYSTFLKAATRMQALAMRRSETWRLCQRILKYTI